MRRISYILLCDPGFPGGCEMVITLLAFHPSMLLAHDSRLRDDERTYIRARLRKDQGRSARERQITPTDVLNCFKDYKFFLGGFMYFGLIVPGTNPINIVRDFTQIC